MSLSALFAARVSGRGLSQLEIEKLASRSGYSSNGWPEFGEGGRRSRSVATFRGDRGEFFYATPDERKRLVVTAVRMTLLRWRVMEIEES